MQQAIQWFWILPGVTAVGAADLLRGAETPVSAKLSNAVTAVSSSHYE